MSDNEATIIGNATRDPELKFLQSGTAVVNLGVAVNKRRFNKDTNEYDTETSFFDCTAYKGIAENIAASVAKGTRVILAGRFEQRSWETQDGGKRSKVEFVIDDAGPSLKWSVVETARSAEQPITPQADDKDWSGDSSGDPF